MEYKLLVANNAESLSKYVTEALDLGWTLYGPPLAIPFGETIATAHFAQAVTRAR